MPSRLLYQFPISHFCEKTRWNLDAKGVEFRVRDVVPGWHRITMRSLSPRGTVPVLVDGASVITDSVSIAAHLERAYPEVPLLPADEPSRARALELEEWLGRHAGRAIRQWMYGQLGARPGGMVEVLFAAYPPAVRFAGKMAARILEPAMKKQYRIDAEGIAKARRTIDEVLDRVERETGGDPARYLVGDALSIADITAASLLGPLLAPPGSPWARTAGPGAPAPIRELRTALASRPAWAWAHARYARDRHRT
jgi:glutathione S-transferase